MTPSSLSLLLPAVAAACLALGALAGAALARRPRSARPSTDGEPGLQKAYLEHLFQASSEAIVLLDNHDRVVEANPEFVRLFGYAADRIAGRPINELIVPDELRDEGDMLTRQVTAGGRFAVETVRRREDGTRLDVAVSGIPVLVDGRQVGIYGIYRDVTAARRMEEERAGLLAREREARGEAEAAGRRAAFLADASTVLNASLDYREGYRQLARLVVPFLADYCLIDEATEDGGTQRIAVAHVDPEKERTQLLRDVRNPPDADPEERPVLRVVRSGQPLLVADFTSDLFQRIAYDQEHRERMLSGGLRSFVIVPLIARGRTLGAITLAYADSGRRYGPADLALAEELARRAALVIDNARLYGDARQAVRTRDEVMGVVSHDLRNPLAAIHLNASFLLASGAGLEGWVQEQLGWIVRSAEQAERMIQDLLDVTRIEAGQLAVFPVPCSAGTLLRDAYDLLAPLAAERGVELRADVDASARVQADPDRVQQVFSNLVGNAIKFTPRGGTVEIRAEPDGEGVRFRVCDTGPGIAPEQLPRVFDRFWQAERGGRNGAGLGLAIARGIVEAHGGRIQVESTPGRGCTFAFTLAAAEELAGVAV